MFRLGNRNEWIIIMRVKALVAASVLSPQPPAEMHSNEITNKYETFNILFSKTMQYYSVPDNVLVVALALIEPALPREAASSAASSKFKF